MANKIEKLTENWDQLTPEQKREVRFNRWVESAKEIKFVNKEAEQRYHKLQKRLIDAFHVREPDRVPVNVPNNSLPFFQEGFNYNIAIHDLEKAFRACLKFNAAYAAQLECYNLPFLIPARVFEKLDYRLYSWPGYNLADNVMGIQFVEGEYMSADEYDVLIRDPSDFWMRTYLPRVFGVFEPFRKLNPFNDIVEFPVVQLMPLTQPDVQSAFRKLAQAGEDLKQFATLGADFNRQAQENGYPSYPPIGSFTKAPFDTIGDSLRGTQGIMKDMYRQPAKLVKALDAVADLTINNVLNSPVASRGLKLFFPLHKGADGWMSQKQFETFYWPFLKKVMDAFINEGFLVTLFVEGSYNSRLDYIGDFPKGSVHWLFDKTDIFRAKKVLGSNFCIEGNVPSSLLITGNKQDVKEYCRKLIEVCGQGGGYILSSGAVVDNPKLENLLAMVEAAKEYGVYKP